MNDRVLTIDDVMALRVCCEREVVEAWAAGRTEMRLSEILRLSDVTEANRIWLACQPGVLPVAIRQQWMDGIAHRTVREHALHCGVASVEAWARSWLAGEDRTTRSARAARAAAEARAAEARVAAARAPRAPRAAAARAAEAARAAAEARAAEARVAAARAPRAPRAAAARAAEAARAAAEARAAEAWWAVRAARAAAWAAEAAEEERQIGDLLTLLAEA